MTNTQNAQILTVKALIQQSRGQFMRGDENKNLRIDIMAAIIGRKPKPSECGVNYVINALLEFSGCHQNVCRAVVEDNLRIWGKT